MARPAEAKAVLTDIEVLEVSLVGKGANKRPIIMMKSDGGAGDASPAPTDPSADPAAPATPASDMPTAPASTEQPPAEPVSPAVAPASDQPTGVDPGQTGEPAGEKDKAEKTDAEPVEVSKRGAKMARERLTKFKTAYDQLGAILKELEEVLAGDDVEKAEDENPLAAEVAELKRQLEAVKAEKAKVDEELAGQRALVGKQAALLKVASESPAPNSITPEGVAKKDSPVLWPSDLNENRGK